MKGCYLDRFGDFLLYQSALPPTSTRLKWLSDMMEQCGGRGVYFKQLDRRLRDKKPEDAGPIPIIGEEVKDDFFVRENGLRFCLSFKEGYSCGLFMDQRENRSRILKKTITNSWPFPAPKQSKPLQLLNVFAYTCSFSVAAASVGIETTSLDLSKKYLEWGKKNFEANGLSLDHHDFIYGDAFNWMKRLAKKGRKFDFIILDPPTFSSSKESGIFQVEKHLTELVGRALDLLSDKGILLVASNKAEWRGHRFEDYLVRACISNRWHPKKRFYVGQPPDFPVSDWEKPYLNTCWIKVARV